MDHDEPIVLRSGGRIPGHVALAPLTNTQSHPDGTLGDDELRWMARRSTGAFAMVSTCATFVSEEGHAWVGQLGIATDDHLPGLTRLAAAMKAHGSFAVVQLHHGGAKADQAPVKLSTIDGDRQRAATPDDIERVIADFVAAARRARQAGFDGVELHGANGYLFTQFLAPEDNPRTDAWGGALAGRAKLLRDALRAVRAAVPPPFTVGVRLSPVDTWARRGLVLSDGVQVGQWLAEDGADYLHLSLSNAAGPPPHEAVDTPVATAFREAIDDDVPLLAAGGMWTPQDVQRARDVGVDVAVLGRAAIANPDWPRTIVRPPWSIEHLRSVDVSDRFLDYLKNFAGLVEGGTPAR